MDMETKTFKYREYFCLIVITLLNCALFYESWRIFSKRMEGDSPGTFPLLLSAVMILLSILLLATAKRRLPECSDRFPSFGAAILASAKEEVPKNVLLSFAASVVYVVLMQFIGFIASTFIFLAGLMIYFSRKKWKAALITSAASVAFIYVVFGMIFHVRLP